MTADDAAPVTDPAGGDRIVWVQSAHLRLALHHLRDGEGRPLLLVHGLGERTPDEVPEDAAAWPGPVWGLDLSGHGRSETPVGGGYTAESLLGDVDAALAHLGPSTVLGRGLGAYVALLAAGGRPTLVCGAVLTDGCGLAGGGATPHTSSIVAPTPAPVGADPGATPDPWALVELSSDVRPPDYAASYVHQAVAFGGLSVPIVVAARISAPWLDAVAAEPGVERAAVTEALARYARQETPDPDPA